MIALLRQVADPGKTEGALWAEMRVHAVPNPTILTLGYSTKLNAEWPFLEIASQGRTKLCRQIPT